MTLEQYYAEVAWLNLKPSSVPHVYFAADGTAHNVPDGRRLTPEEREDTIRYLTGMIRGFTD